MTVRKRCARSACPAWGWEQNHGLLTRRNALPSDGKNVARVGQGTPRANRAATTACGGGVVSLNAAVRPSARDPSGGASVYGIGTHKIHRAHTGSSPTVRWASRPRARCADSSADDRSRDTAARAQEPQGSASRLSIASGLVRDPCAVPEHHSRRRLEQPTSRITAEKSRACSGRGVPFSSVELSHREQSHDKVLAAGHLPLAMWFARAEERKNCCLLMFTD